jgi:FAD synthetase
VWFLEEAKRAGGENAKLIAIIATDNTAEKSKGRKPIMSEDQRCALVKSLRVVDEAVVGYENMDIGEVIEKIKPDVIALGYDSKNKLHVKIVRIGKFAENALDSSSKIKQKIIDKLSK